ILLFSLLVLIIAVVIFILASLQPVDRSPYTEASHYRRMMNQLDSLSGIPVPEGRHGLRLGFSKVNLTPPYRVATAGYGKRRGREFTAVHDSLFVRAIVVENGSQRVAIVSADLLIIPPKVTEELHSRL